jgi:hypothetical protein
VPFRRSHNVNSHRNGTKAVPYKKMAVVKKSRIEVLNRLLAIHYRSLPMYLRDARPWKQSQDDRADELLSQIIAEHERMVQHISETVLELGGDIEPGEFPMLFTDMHDLSYDYLLRQLVEQQRQMVVKIQECVNAAPGEPLAQEALGLAKGHLEELQELAASKPATV